MNCDGDVPLDIALDEATESLLQQYTVKLGECFSSTRLNTPHQNVTFIIDFLFTIGVTLHFTHWSNAGVGKLF